MSDIPNIPTKYNEGCSLIKLIDENQCVGNSLDIINDNVTGLSKALNDLENYANYWNEAYTTFQANSASWLMGSTYLQKYSEQWNSAYTTVEALSATWTPPFVVFYPTIFYIEDWYSNQNYHLTNTLPTWINANFPPQIFADGQIVYIQVNLYHVQPFTFSFYRDYWENCAPLGGTTLSCGECGRPSRGCNHHGGKAGWGPCDNAFKYCGVNITMAESTFSCQGTGGRQLAISSNYTTSDTSVARILKFCYVNSNNKSWNYLSS
jgi:hypothetical protein